MILDDFNVELALWCGADKDAADLARAVELVAEHKLPIVSVTPQVVPVVWPWLEKIKTKIMARFYLSEGKISENTISDTVKNINLTFKQGANGAQVFLRYADLSKVVDYLYIIKDDLFFDKDLSVGIDLGDVGPFDWNDLFFYLKKINAGSVLFVFTKDLGNKSDFVGRIYAMLNAWNKDNEFELHFAVGQDVMRIEQVVRLVESMQSQLIKKLKFFVNF